METRSAARIRLLIVESNQTEAQRLIELGKTLGIPLDFATANSLQQAESLLKDNPNEYDLIFLNLMLIDSGGTFSFHRVQRLNPTCPVVIFNAPRDEVLMNQTLEAGAAEYIQRGDLGTDQLKYVIDKTIARRKFLHEAKMKSLAMAKNDRLDALYQLASKVNQEFESPIGDLSRLLGQLKEEAKVGAPITPLVQKLIEDSLEASKKIRSVIQELQTFAVNISEEMPALVERDDIRFLVVEDEEEIAALVSHRLSLLGYREVQTAKNGKDAYNRCVESLKNRNKISAVISDLNMPVENGLQLLKNLRRNVFFEKVPFMLITAVDDRVSLEMAIQNGVDELLIKPFRQADFDARVSNLLLKRGVLQDKTHAV